jgi:hypothetical protein
MGCFAQAECLSDLFDCDQVRQGAQPKRRRTRSNGGPSVPDCGFKKGCRLSQRPSG